MAFTYFFRDTETLYQVAKHVLVPLREAQSLRIWDAGCATGEETYSLSILIAETLGIERLETTHILASDHEENSCFRTFVEEGEFPERTMRDCPRADWLARHTMAGRQPESLRFAPYLRRSISYLRHDLLSLSAVGVDFDLIVCKNVLLHFPPEMQQEVVGMFYWALKPDGYLVFDRQQALPEPFSQVFEEVEPGFSLYHKKGP